MGSGARGRERARRTSNICGLRPNIQHLPLPQWRDRDVPRSRDATSNIQWSGAWSDTAFWNVCVPDGAA